MPRVQMDPNDGPLAEAGGKVHLVSFVMQQTWQREHRGHVFFRVL